MKRELIPGMWGRSGQAVPYCAGNCNQGRVACDCCTELACEIAPDASRFLTPSSVEDHNYRARALRRMLASAIGAWLAFAVLIYLARLATNGA